MIHNLALPTLHIGDKEIFCSDSERNIGAIFDTTMRMQEQISKNCKSAWCHLAK